MKQIIHGDSKIELKKLKANSIDCIVTDQPYAISFMSREWDKAIPGTDIWKQCLRVLKPGCFAFVMSAPRQDVLSRVIVTLEDSGFVTSFTSMYWANAKGFPKAQNMSKAVDKRLGVTADTEEYEHPQRKNRKQNFSVGFSDSQDRVKDGKPIRTKPTSPQAKKLDGAYAGFQPKPAVEVVVTVMKPLTKKTYAEQAMHDGKGITWLDDCKIPFVNDDDFEKSKTGHKRAWSSDNTHEGWQRKVHKHYTKAIPNPQGRFPANLLVSGSVLDTGNITKSQGGKTTRDTAFFNKSKFKMQGYGDTGDFSRYFDLDAWSKQHLSQFIITPKPAISEKELGLDKFMQGHKSTPKPKKIKRKNIHPTIKPISLMSYLIKLGSREGDIILDPFLGSGTTAIAADMLHRQYIGIEKEKEFYDLANARLTHYRKNQKLPLGEIIC